MVPPLAERIVKLLARLGSPATRGQIVGYIARERAATVQWELDRLLAQGRLVTGREPNRLRPGRPMVTYALSPQGEPEPLYRRCPFCKGTGLVTIERAGQKIQRKCGECIEVLHVIRVDASRPERLRERTRKDAR